jgi:outer membrane protein TolC
MCVDACSERRRFSLLLLLGALVLSGCAQVPFDQTVAKTNHAAAEFTEGHLRLVTTPEDRLAAKQLTAELLQQPLSQKNAVHLTLVHSPALQSLLAESWAKTERTLQSARITNPLFSLTRLRFAGELDIERVLSFGLLDLLTLPERQQIAQQQIDTAQLRLTAEVIQRVTQVRTAWVAAVAAQQRMIYAKQVVDSAQASAELALRMQRAGNFNKLAWANQQTFFMDAVTQQASAQQKMTATREALVRLIGLSDDEASQLRLPERLPDIPRTPRDPKEVSQLAGNERLDIRIAQSAFNAAAKAQGLNQVTSLVDIELGIRRDTKFSDSADSSSAGRGFEISLRLPIFDWSDAQRRAMNAETLALANQLEATVREAGSRLRERYAAYRTSYAVAKHYRDEVLPLRKAISKEMLLRYNGMLIGVFDLLTDSRIQINSVIEAIVAEEQFFKDEAALQAEMIGQPIAELSLSPKISRNTGNEAVH